MYSPDEMKKFDTFAAVIARLRGPDGCPWDKEQTHRSLRENLLSECYEVLEALDAAETEKLKEELGDLLLQIVLQAQIAADSEEFEIGDVIRGITEKIIRRHPHIFGSGKAKNADEVMHNWEVLKQKEREEGASMLSSVPKAMPALAYALEIQRRVARVGFDWENLDGVIDKLVEEVKEYKAASSNAEKAQEYGDLLFTLANIARREGVDPEASLREANKRFYKRFTYMEKLCRERGLTFDKLTFDEQNDLWEEAKRGVG
ncbi:MAG: nucleoside triphosphate pyrophosphohydrolase [Dehalococcoidales bacterium]